MSCVLRLAGANLSVDDLIRSTSLSPNQIYRKGEARLSYGKSKGSLYQESGVNFSVSDSGFDELPEQIQDATIFLENNFQEMKLLCSFQGVESPCLDFGIKKRDVAAQFDRFPSKLLLLMGELGIDLETSLYSIGE